MLLAIEEHILEDITSAKSGDTEAFTRIITHARNTVTSIALAIVQDLDNSEEVAQQVFISIWENLDSLKNSASFYPWIRQMTRYKAYNFLRDNKLDRKITGEHANYLLAEFCDPHSNQLEQMERTQQSQILAQFIGELPNESREIVLLYYREEESTKQVANLLELSETNVRKKLSRIRKRLKGQLLERYGRLILSTAPTVGLTSLVISSLTAGSPVAAATLVSTISSGKSGVFSKFALSLSGALIGVAGGVLGLIWGSRQPIKRISDRNAKNTMLKYRNQAVIWVIASGILFALSFQFTTGWLLPVATYTLFAIGLIIQLNKMGRFALKHIYPLEPTQPDRDKIKAERVWQLLGLFGGVIAGFTGLIIGMISDGRIS